VLSGRYAPPAGWYIVKQRGGDLGERIAHGFADTALPGIASMLIGMDTPQITPALLVSVYAGLASAEAVLAPSEDGGWWALALRDPYQALALRDVPMSTSDSGDLTIEALRGRGLRVLLGATLRGVDTAADAQQVAAQCRPGAFADAVRAHLPLNEPQTADLR
jgi:glycosyltransferase A (GT-A) superfamily protein (DUF2064 family)